MKFVKRLFLTAIILLFGLGHSGLVLANAKVVVVTSPKNDIQNMDKKELIDLYMGKYNAFSNGKQATPIDIGQDAQLKELFYKELVGLPLARVNAYWSRLKFSGRATPPVVEQAIEDVQLRLEQDQSAVAYVYESNVTEEMKVVYRFD